MLVVGFDVVSRSWVAGDSGVEVLPLLDGELLLDEASRGEVSQDAGRYLSQTPQAVLRPGSVNDVQAMIRFCRKHEITVAARGLANTTHGQGLVGGLLIDMRSLNTIHEIHEDRAVVDAGADWLQLTTAATREASPRRR
ncbi:hypothetical protein GCM10009789_15980 [Kribbella sancticallisti]|uniref:FAD-binding PCMH-type domain-containing protein n=1 Tax=Kribbella sancticallisti TaxID=460087 RepID=A0ABP4NNZ6_9ACTN